MPQRRSGSSAAVSLAGPVPMMGAAFLDFSFYDFKDSRHRKYRFFA